MLQFLPSNEDRIMPTIITQGAASAFGFGFSGSSWADLLISPSVNGLSTWNFAAQGSLVISTAGIYTITVLNPIQKTIKMWGGGGGNNARNGGGGGYSTGIYAFSKIASYTIVVGSGATNGLPGAYGGGGTGGTATGGTYGGGGGGFTGIFSGTAASLASAIALAGGGGGPVVYEGGYTGGPGGAGGGATGQTGQSGGSTAGFGGTQSAGGGAGSPFDAQSVNPTSGSALQGGNGGSVNSSDWVGGGAGGGGYYGGGGGAGGGGTSGAGGGGSGYVGGLIGGTTLSGSGYTPANSSDSQRGNAGNSQTDGSFIIVA